MTYKKLIREKKQHEKTRSAVVLPYRQEVLRMRVLYWDLSAHFFISEDPASKHLLEQEVCDFSGKFSAFRDPYKACDYACAAL